MDDFQKEQKTHFEKYLKSRKSDNMRDVVRQILLYMTERKETDLGTDAGWVRSSELREIFESKPNTKSSKAVFYRILDDLVSDGFVQVKRGSKDDKPGRNPRLYRAIGVLGRLYLMSDRELRNHILKQEENFEKVSMRLFATESLLAQCHKNEPGYNRREEIQKETLRLFPNYGKKTLKKI